ncbi:MAG: MMPL family transporter [Deltaproteobacteria bacterium]|nr:MMPL family transporter [Deltaproteobacteria bacterium]
MRTTADLLLRFPRSVLLACLALTVLLGLAARGLRIEGSLQSVLPADDPGVRYYDGVREAFGSDDIAVVGVRADDLFASATLVKLARVTDQLAALDGVERVLSLTNTVDPAADVFDPPKLLPHIPPRPADIAALKEKLAANPVYAQNLVARDGRGAAINVVFKPMSDAEYADLRLDERIAAILAEATGPEQFVYTGVSRVTQAAVHLMRRDLLRFTPLAVAAVMIVLWFAFRRVRAVVLPLVTVSLAVVWTLGVMALAGKAITLGTFMLPPLLLVVGSAQAMHLIAAYYEQLGRGDRGGAVERAVQQTWAPLLISSFTTAVGFGALMLSRIVAIRDLGLIAVVGMVLVTVSSIGFLPAALCLWARYGSQAETPPSPRVENFLARLGAQAYAARSGVLLAAAALASVALIGAGRILVDSDFLTYFDSDNPVRRDHELINQQIVGSNPFYLVVEGEPGALRKWDVLRKVKDLQTFVGTLPGVSGSISLVDYLELLEKGLNKSGEDDILVDADGKVIEGGRAQTFWENPGNLPTVLNLIAVSPSTFRAVVSPDFARASIVVRSQVSGSREIEAMLRQIRAYVAAEFPAGLRVVPTGSLVLLTGTSSSIVYDQIKSVSLALFVIFAVMALMLLSLRIGLLAILPNVLAIDVFFGLLGWLNLPLNLGTSLIATIALGIAVDSSVHYMWRLSRELRGESDQAAAIQRAMRAVGGPMLYTTLALAAGFFTFVGSGFPPIRNFGGLTAITLLTAFAANLAVLPALLATTKIITLWDLIGVKLGSDPTRTIPLLAGLRPAQARIVVLMGELRHFPPGAQIVRQGERGGEMFVILDGATDVLVGDGAERRRVAEFKRGDVFGEMALVRDEERSADVVARSPVEVLAVDERFLQRIQRRYPRIAARVFLNLTRILSDRLERMNQRLARAT